MKQLIARTLASVLLIVMSAAGLAHGQVTSWVIKVNIPFEFNVGDKTFPAGAYSLVQPVQHYLVLRDSEGRNVASVFASGIDSSTAPASSKLRFESAGGQHILAEVWQQQDSSGLRLLPSKARGNFARHRTSEARETAEGSQP
jgi:hypothetical protein